MDLKIEKGCRFAGLQSGTLFSVKQGLREKI